MSHQALIWATAQRGLKPATKLLLIQLADHHNPVNGCFPGQELLSDECEMSIRSVRDHLGILESLGLIRRIKCGGSGTRRRSDRYVFAFEQSGGAHQEADSRSANTGKTASPSQENTGKPASELPANLRKNYRQNLPPNLVKEPVRKTCAAKQPSIENAFAEFWKAHPRPSNDGKSFKLFEDAVKAGVDPTRITRAAERYASENAGNNRMYVSYSSNWLEARRWEDYPEEPQISASDGPVPPAATFWAGKIRSGSYVPQSAVSSALAECMVSAGLVTAAQMRRAGLQP